MVVGNLNPLKAKSSFIHGEQLLVEAEGEYLGLGAMGY